ncbi:MAG: hypothetical protein WBE18_01550 [Gammaproteobacteria bacterium]
MVSTEEMSNIASLKIGSAARVRELAMHYLMPTKPASEQEKGSPDYVRKMANATAAVEVVCSLVNTFGVMVGLKNFSSGIAIADLVFALNTNTFWVANAAYLTPILNVSVNAFLDNGYLVMEGERLWDNLAYHNRTCWLEVLPAVVFCLKGYTEMRRISLEMKKAFEPLLG